MCAFCQYIYDLGDALGLIIDAPVKSAPVRYDSKLPTGQAG